MAWVAVAAVAAIGSAALTGYSSYQNNKAMGRQAEADSKAVAAQGRLEAERIRKDKDKAQSAARAALAESGLDVNEGTSIVINDQIERDGNYDAAMAEITGKNTSNRLKAEASGHRSNANTAALAGVLNTASAGASGYSKANTALAAKNTQSSNTSGGWK